MLRATAPADVWSGTIVLGSGIVVYTGPGATASAHRHDAIQIIWSPVQPIRLGTEDGVATTRAAIVASGQSHDVVADGSPLTIVLVEPSGQLGQRLDAAARRSPNLSAPAVDDLRFPATTDPAAIVGWGRYLVGSIVGDLEIPAPATNGIRTRLHEACRFIDAHLDQVPLLADTARHVGYSPRQLRRSFAEEIGMPYRRYVLWRRLRAAVLSVRDGADLTNAAAAAGFADSAHFSRTFRRTFGLTPSEILPLATVAEGDFAGN